METIPLASEGLQNLSLNMAGSEQYYTTYIHLL